MVAVLPSVVFALCGAIAIGVVRSCLLPDEAHGFLATCRITVVSEIVAVNDVLGVPCLLPLAMELIIHTNTTIDRNSTNTKTYIIANINLNTVSTTTTTTATTTTTTTTTHTDNDTTAFDRRQPPGANSSCCVRPYK